MRISAFKTSHGKLITAYLMFQACFTTSKLDEDNVKEQLSVSPRRPEDVQMLRAVLFSERGRC